MKIDLHVHASERSGCATSTEEEQVRMAIGVGLDGMAFTDHGKLVPAERLVELNRRFAPFRIFTGIEITAEQEDFVVLGVHDKALEGTWLYLDLHAFVRRKGGYMIMAHPFRYRPELNENILKCPPDAMEVRSVNTPVGAEQRIRDVCRKLDIPVLCNSDSHNRSVLGSYFNIIEGSPAHDVELVAALKKGGARCCGLDGDRDVLRA